MTDSLVNCTDIEPLLDAFHDGELDSAERQSIEKHLAACQVCPSKLAEIGRLVTSLRSLPELKPTKDFADAIPDFEGGRRRVFPASRAGGQGQEKGLDQPLAFRRLTWISAAVAAAAALLLFVFKTSHGTNSPALVAKGPPAPQSGSRQVASQTKDIRSARELADNASRPEETTAHSAGTALTAAKERQGKGRSVSSATGEIASNPGKSGHPAIKSPGSEQPKLKLAQNPPGENAQAVSGAEQSRNRTDGTTPSLENEEGSHGASVEVATLDEVGHSTITGAIGLSTDEDGLYAIKM